VWGGGGGGTKVMRISRQPSPLQIMTDQKLNNVEYFYYFGSMINYARCTCEIKSRITMTKATFNKTTFDQKVRIKCNEETSKVLHLEHSVVR
jgi:hypothetical protein